MNTEYDELIKRLREPCQYENCVLCNEAADAIEDLDFACNRYEKDYKALCEYLPKWIPVTERLPSDNTPVLVVNDDGKVIVAKYEKDIFGWYYKYCEYDFDVWDALENGVITHWMPLPQPPKHE